MATKWGVVSAGRISHDFVTAVRSIPGNEHEFIAVAARSLESAKEFATRHNIPKAYGSYEEMTHDPDIEVAYIGSVTSEHLSLGKLMLENGKHVLIEKPMALNVKQVKALIEIARKNKRFLMEAIWSRFTPAYVHLMELLKKKTIGDILHVSCNFGLNVSHLEWLMTNATGGGTLISIGIYTINAVTMIYNGEKPEKIAAVGQLNENGVDVATLAIFTYSKNRTAQVSSSGILDLPSDLVITGTKGHIKIPKHMWAPTSIETSDGTINFSLPDTILPCNYINSSLLRYEAMEVRKCILEGVTESSIMPLKDSVMLAEIMDEIRHQIGVKYDAD